MNNAMNTDLMISALRMGKNGSQILQILDALCDDSTTAKNNVTKSKPKQGTLDPIDF